MSVLYTYAKLCDVPRLSREIKEAVLITVGEELISTVSSPATTNVYMKAALSENEENHLDAIVAAHVNTPLEENEPKLFTTGVKDPVLGREVFSMSAFAVNYDYEVKATGFAGTAAAGVVTNLDFAIGVEDRFIHGLNLILKNHADGDTIGLSVIDKDGILSGIAYPPNTPLPVVLKTFGINWNVDASIRSQGREGFNYIARIMAGLYIRLAYTSTGEVPVSVRLNTYLHKKI